MNENLIKVLSNNVYHGVYSLLQLIILIDLSDNIKANTSVMFWVIYVLLTVVFAYNMFSIKRFKV